MDEVGIGMLVGVVMGAAAAAMVITMNGDSGLEDCAKAANVYECKWVALPVEGEKKHQKPNESEDNG